MSEWNESVLKAVDSVVDIATTKVVKPAHKFARASVYGFVAVSLAFIAFILIVIAAFRATTLAVPVYGAYLIWGGIFFAIGALIWAKK